MPFLQERTRRVLLGQSLLLLRLTCCLNWFIMSSCTDELDLQSEWINWRSFSESFTRLGCAKDNFMEAKNRIGVYYFGCQKDNKAGHYWSSHPVNMNMILCRCVDGGFTPTNGALYRYKVSTVPPWTFISWNDNSVDKRSGSHSTFAFVGYVTTDPEQLLKIAQLQFPWVFARLPVPLGPEAL